MKKKILIGSIIAVALLTLVSFSSVVGYSSVKNTQEENITDEWDFEYCKDYLFETMVEISNNEDVKDLTSSNNQNMFPTNSNNRLLMPFRRNTNKVSLSVEHLDLLYNMGIKLIDRLGENKVAEIWENVEIDKPEFADELETIIMGNDELKERIYTLIEMNVESETLDWGFPIICGIIFMIEAPLGIIDLIFTDFLNFLLYGGFFSMLFFLPFALIYDLMWYPLREIISSRTYFIADMFNCFDINYIAR